jgi:hypothetical protein
VTDALQQFRVEIVNNERRLESLRMARLASWLSNDIRGPQLRYFDPAMFAPMDTTLRGGIAIGLAGDATVERAQLALDRLLAAHQYLHQALTAIAYPDQARAALKPAAPAAVPAPLPLPPAIPSVLQAAQRAEKAAAALEAETAERELNARQKERAAEASYRNSQPADRAAAREAWLRLREEWEQARRDWDAARDQWQAARDRLEAAQRATTLAAPAIPSKPVRRSPLLPRP